MKKAAAMLAAILAVAALFTVAQCFRWTGSLQDEAFVAVCVRDNLRLPWQFSLSSGETVHFVKWYVQSTSGQDTLLANYISGVLLTSSSYSQRTQYLANGGLVLHNMTLGDSGNYTVEVGLRDASGTFQKHTSTAVVEVAAGLLLLEEPSAVYEAVTDSWHVYLSCGTVVSPDQSPRHVVWQTPSGESPSTKYKDGRFYLKLDNPVRGGNYSCSLADDSTAKVCPPLASQGPVLKVNAVRTQFSLLKAENRQLRKRGRETQTQLSDLKELVNSFVNTTNTLRDKRVVFHVWFPRSANYSSGSIITMSHVPTNLGNGYNSSTGRFTAPHSGYYFFTLTSTGGGYSTSTSYYANLYLMMNGAHRWCTVSKSVDYHEQATCSYAGYLNKGQQVWLQATGDVYLFKTLTTFSGFLITPE